MAIGVRPAAIATTTPVTMVETCGVPKRGWTRPAQAGIRPSFDIARKMRGCASIITTITELSAATAPSVSRIVSAFMSGAHGVPAARPAAASIATTSGAG